MLNTAFKQQKKVFVKVNLSLKFLYGGLRNAMDHDQPGPGPMALITYLYIDKLWL